MKKKQKIRNILCGMCKSVLRERDRWAKKEDNVFLKWIVDFWYKDVFIQLIVFSLFFIKFCRQNIRRPLFYLYPQFLVVAFISIDLKIEL